MAIRHFIFVFRNYLSLWVHQWISKFFHVVWLSLDHCIKEPANHNFWIFTFLLSMIILIDILTLIIYANISPPTQKCLAIKWFLLVEICLRFLIHRTAKGRYFVMINPFSINFPIMNKPGSWFLLAKCLKKTCGRVTF